MSYTLTFQASNFATAARMADVAGTFPSVQAFSVKPAGRWTRKVTVSLTVSAPSAAAAMMLGAAIVRAAA